MMSMGWHAQITRCSAIHFFLFFQTSYIIFWQSFDDIFSPQITRDDVGFALVADFYYRDLRLYNY